MTSADSGRQPTIQIGILTKGRPMLATVIANLVLQEERPIEIFIVDRDPTKVDPQQLARTEVLETWVGGSKVWSRPASASRPERGK